MILNTAQRPAFVAFRRNPKLNFPVRGISITSPRCSERALPSQPARTRFAPSPTGYMHLGSLRTALYNFLLAKATKGQFILRIEDTDIKRAVADAESRLYEDLRWAGIEWDEGPTVGGPFGPYRQSERTKLYKDHADKLIASGNAYRCFCSAEHLNQLAKTRQQLNLPATYDRSCESIPRDVADRRAANGEEHTIRLRSPQTPTQYRDLVYGTFGGKAKATPGYYDDPILLKSDGMPTYHLASVVDDHHMRITHVVRGAEWMPSTPRHVALYHAFGWQPPAFAHVGLLQDSQGQKLSKRHSAVDVRSLARDGILPEALTNYVALLGWSHREKTDFLPLSYLIKIFDMNFTKGNTIVGPKKLAYLQKMYGQKYIETESQQFLDMAERLCSRLKTSKRWDSSKIPIPPQQDLLTYISSILRSDPKHYESIDLFLLRNEGFFRDTLIRPSPVSHDWPGDVAPGIIEAARSQFSEIPQDLWMEDELKRNVQRLVFSIFDSRWGSETTKSTSSQINEVLRWAIFAGKPGPPMVKTMEVLGREGTLNRLKEALEDCQKQMVS